MLIVLEKYILLRSMLQTSKNQVFSSFLLDTQSVILWHYTCTYLNIVTLSYNSNWNSMGRNALLYAQPSVQVVYY